MDCCQAVVEKIYLALNPYSRHSGIDPIVAVTTIDFGLLRGLDLLEFAAMFEGDHATGGEHFTFLDCGVMYASGISGICPSKIQLLN